MFWESVYDLETGDKLSTIKNLETYEEANEKLKQFGKITHEKYDINKEQLFEFYRRPTPGISEYVDTFLEKFGNSNLLTTTAVSCTREGVPDYFYFGLYKNNYDYINRFGDDIKFSQSLLLASMFVYVRMKLDGKFDSISYEIYTDGFYETIMNNYFKFHNKINCHNNLIRLIKENKSKYFIYRNKGRHIVYVVESEKTLPSFTGKIKLKSISEKSIGEIQGKNLT